MVSNKNSNILAYINISLDFWQTPSHFEPIASVILSTFQSLPSAVPLPSSAIVSTVTYLAAAANSPEHLKTINTALLKLFRHDEAVIRLAAVECQQSLTDKLGEDWLALLPEMLPFISELLEDDDEQVEYHVRKWIGRIETILGEDVLGMLQ